MMNTQTFYSLPSISNSNENAHQQLSNTRFPPRGGQALRNDKIKYSFLWLILILLTLWGLTGTLHAQNSPNEGKGSGLDSLLLVAVKADDLEKVKTLVAQGADIQAKNNDGYTPLHYVKSIEIAQLLLEKGADIQAKNKYSYTPLHFALRYDGNPEIAKILIDKGADIQAKNNDGNTPLHLALGYYGNPEIAKLLIDKGADINAKNKDGDTPLLLAKYRNLPKIVQLLINKGANVNAKNKDGYTPLHYPNNLEIAQLLIEKGADIHAKDKDGNTPLHDVRNLEIAQFLITKGARTDIANFAGKIPIQLAQENKNEEIYAFLQGEKSYQTYIKTAPLWNAIKFRNIPKAKEAIKSGADSIYQNYEGKNALDLMRDYDYNTWQDFLDNRLSNKVKPTVQIGHVDFTSIIDIDFLPDGKSFISGDYFNKFIQWDLQTGRILKTFKQIEIIGGTVYIDILPDGKSFLSSTIQLKVIHWDIESGKEIRTFSNTFAVALLPNGTSFLCRQDDYIKEIDILSGQTLRILTECKDKASLDNGKILLLPDSKSFLNVSDEFVVHYDLMTGKEIKRFLLSAEDLLWGGNEPIQILPDGKSFLSSEKESKLITHWNLITGEKIRTYSFLGEQRGQAMLILPDGKSFLLREQSGLINHWDLASGKKIQSFQVSIKGTFGGQLQLAPGGKSFFYTYRNFMKRFELASGKEIQDFPKAGIVFKSIFSKDGKSIVTSGANGIINRWDLVSSKIIQTYEGNGSSASSKIIATKDGQKILNAINKQVIYWDLNSGKPISVFQGHIAKFSEIILLPDNQTFLTYCNRYNDENKDFSIRYWDITTSKEIRTFAGHTGYVSQILLLPDNKSFLTASSDKTVKHWDLASGKEIRNFQDASGSILLLPDNKYFLTASDDKTVKQWDLASGKEIRTFAGHTGHITQILLLPDNKSFLTASDDKTVKHWDLATGEEIRSFQRQHTPVLLPDNKTFLTGSDDNTLKQWDLASGKEIRSFQGTSSFSQILFLPDKKTFLTGNHNDNFKHWDLATGKEIRSFQANLSYFNEIILLPDNKTFLTGSFVNIIKHWDIATGKELGTFRSQYGAMFSIHFLPDSSRFITVNEQNSLTLWDMKTYQEIATLIPVAGDNQDYVVITPDGRFDGTPVGMDKLVHFVAGNEIIELSQLKERFYTPDLWKTLLTAPEKLGTVENLKEIRLYPEMELKGKGNTLTINLKARSGGIGKVNVYINGREVNEIKSNAPDFNPQHKTQIQINLKNYQSYFSEGKNTISIKAYHAEGWLASRFQHITYQKGKSLQNRGTDTTSKAKPEGLQEDEIVDFDANITESKTVGDFYALCIGTSDYVGEGIKDLTFPTSDAQSMAEALQIGAKKFFIDEDEPNKNKLFIRTLTTDDKNPLNQPSKDNIRRVFGEIASKAKAEDMFVVFFAGHGTTFKKEDERFELFYYLTKDAGSRSVTQDALRKSHTISSDELIAWLKEIKAGKQVMILDACHSGQAVDNIFAQRDIPPSQKRALELMKDRTGLYIISGSAADAVSYESSEYGQGFLTYSLLMGMTGAALDKETSHLNVGTWFKYASNEVNRMAAEYNSTQQPQVAEPKNNFWIGKFEEKDRNLIPLKEAKPMFGVPTFLNEDKLRDDLGLTKLVKSELVEGLYNARSANYIFTDSDSKKIHQINGLYTIDTQGNIKITLKIYKGDTLVAEIKDLEGNTKEIKDLAEQIVSEAKKRVVK